MESSCCDANVIGGKCCLCLENCSYVEPVNKIKFKTMRYPKLFGVIGQLQLIHVFKERYENLGDAFKEYDTVYFEGDNIEYYKLPKKGDCLVLFLMCVETGTVFTTVRSASSFNLELYMNSIEKYFELEEVE